MNIIEIGISYLYAMGGGHYARPSSHFAYMGRDMLRWALEEKSRNNSILLMFASKARAHKYLCMCGCVCVCVLCVSVLGLDATPLIPPRVSEWVSAEFRPWPKKRVSDALWVCLRWAMVW